MDAYREFFGGDLEGTIRHRKDEDNIFTIDEAKYNAEQTREIISGRTLLLNTTTTCFLVSYKASYIMLNSGHELGLSPMMIRNLSDHSEQYNLVVVTNRSGLFMFNKTTIYQTDYNMGIPDLMERSGIPVGVLRSKMLKEALNLYSPNVKIMPIVSRILGHQRLRAHVKIERESNYPEHLDEPNPYFRDVLVQDPFVTPNETLRHLEYQEDRFLGEDEPVKVEGIQASPTTGETSYARDEIRKVWIDPFDQLTSPVSPISINEYVPTQDTAF